MRLVNSCDTEGYVVCEIDIDNLKEGDVFYFNAGGWYSRRRIGVAPDGRVDLINDKGLAGLCYAPLDTIKGVLAKSYYGVLCPEAGFKSFKELRETLKETPTKSTELPTTSESSYDGNWYKHWVDPKLRETLPKDLMLKPWQEAFRKYYIDRLEENEPTTEESKMNTLKNPIERRTLYRGQNIATMTAEQLIQEARNLTAEIAQLEADDFKSSRVDKHLVQLRHARELIIKTVDAEENS